MLASAFAAAVFAQTTPPAGSPVAQHGQLKIVGNQVLDKNNQPVQLRGMSFFWDCWAASFYNANVVNTLVDDWEATLVRAAYGGAGNEPNCVGGNKTATTAVVDAAIAKGIYVIIDWHSHFADQEQSQAISFFQEMAAAYKDYPNVIYEIFNEPTNQAWAAVIKPYSQALVGAIRAIDPDNLILIGTRQWCQLPAEAAANPVDGENLAYVMHFYAASHGASLRNNTFRALRLNKAIFVSEFGTVLNTGGGSFDQANSDIWMDFMDQFGLSWANWSIFNKNEAASALTPTSGATGGWGTNNFTASGAYIRNRLKTPPKPKTEKSFFALTVDINGSGSGNVYQGTTGIIDPNQVFYKGTRDTILTLRAVPAQGNSFTGWKVNGEDKGSALTVQVTVGGSADVAVTATFGSTTSALPAAARSKAAPWSVKTVSGGIALRGPEAGLAEIALYDMRGKQAGKFLRGAGSGGQQVMINNVPAGNYIVAVRDRASNQEVFRAKVSLVR
jgi:endoglucanase